MVLNADKCHFMCFVKDTENETFIFNKFILNNSNEEKIPWKTIDKKLVFKSQKKKKNTHKIVGFTMAIKSSK